MIILDNYRYFYWNLCKELSIRCTQLPIYYISILCLQVEFKESSGGNAQLIFEEQKGKGTNKTPNAKQVACFSLETMLLALNQTQVDYFSLDVEGLEFDVLKTIPFNRVSDLLQKSVIVQMFTNMNITLMTIICSVFQINISTLSVEYVHGRHGKKAYESFMLEKGYEVHKDIHLHKPDIALFVDGFIFVKADL